MYIALVVLAIGGVGAGLTLHLFGQWWLWISIVILVVTIGLMIGSLRRISAASRRRARSDPAACRAVSDEELEQLLRSGEAHVITAIGSWGSCRSST